MNKERIDEIYKDLLESKKESETLFTRFNIQPHELGDLLLMAKLAFDAKETMLSINGCRQTEHCKQCGILINHWLRQFEKLQG